MFYGTNDLKTDDLGGLDLITLSLKSEEEGRDLQHEKKGSEGPSSQKMEGTTQGGMWAALS